MAEIELETLELETAELKLEMLELDTAELELMALELATLELVVTELATLLATALEAELAGGVTGFEPPLLPPQAETIRLKATKGTRLILGMIIPLIVG